MTEAVKARLVERVPHFILMGVWFAVAIHVIWAALLCVSPTARHTTGIYALSQLFPNRFGLAIILATVAACATLAIFLPLSPSKILLLFPQQLVLGVSAAGALRAMALGHFADGVMRARPFLVADQSPMVLALLIHSVTIVYLAFLVTRD